MHRFHTFAEQIQLTPFLIIAFCRLLATQISSDASHYVQELLDVRQKQQSGTQLVQEIRKQADDVLHLTRFSLPFSSFFWLQ